MKIDAALDLFTTQLQADGRSPHTTSQYRRHIQLLSRWAHDARHTGEIEDVGHEDIARFLSAPVARTRPDGRQKKSTAVNALRSSLKGFFGYLSRGGYIKTDPSRMIRRAICTSAPPRFLSAEEQARLLNTLGRAESPEARRDHVLFHLMLATGIRLGSALAADLRDVDLGSAELRIRTSKGNREEQLFLGNSICEHLAEYLQDREPGPLFAGRGQQPLSPRHVQRRLKLWLKKAGINKRISPHSLRHTLAMGLYEKTGDILLVKEALRHRNIASTLVYARTNEQRLRRALA